MQHVLSACCHLSTPGPRAHRHTHTHTHTHMSTQAGAHTSACTHAHSHSHSHRLDRIGFEMGARLLELLSFRERTLRRKPEVNGQLSQDCTGVVIVLGSRDSGRHPVPCTTEQTLLHHTRSLRLRRHAARSCVSSKHTRARARTHTHTHTSHACTGARHPSLHPQHSMAPHVRQERGRPAAGCSGGWCSANIVTIAIYIW